VRTLLAIAAPPLGLALASSVAAAGAACAGIEIISDALIVRDAQAYCIYAESERRKVDDFWGSTWKEAIRIHVDASYRISRALVPAYLGNRGFIEMPLRGVRNRDGALLHEIVHVYAPNENRFLAEGFAVYLHQKLAANPAFPNYGKPLHAEAQRHVDAIASLAELNGVRTPKRLGGSLGEEAAYLLAGSFVGFLIEQYGLGAFRKLYEGGSYETTYGKSLDELEKEWRALIQRASR
jgi:hypothetical protein